MKTSLRTLSQAALFAAVLPLAACENKAPETTEAPAPEAAAPEAPAPVAEAAPTDAPKAEEPAAAAPSPMPEDLAEGQTAHYGAAFALPGEPIALAQALEKSKEGEGPYKVNAKVDAVCQKKGCWFTLAAEGVQEPIRVRMKDYGFFVPKNGTGSEAIVEGTLVRKVVPQDEAQHYADDQAEGTGKPAAKVEGDQVTYEFMASGIQMARK